MDTIEHNSFIQSRSIGRIQTDTQRGVRGKWIEQNRRKNMHILKNIQYVTYV